MSVAEGTIINKYTIEKQIGQGGMATVYRAKHTMLNRLVAIKMIRAEDTTPEKTEKLLHRIGREAKALARLSHPNIVKVLEYGEFEGSPFLVMEYVTGGSLKSRIQSPIPVYDAAAMLVPVVRALHNAHQKGILHRDIKPENILIGDSSQLMLSDFGITKFIDIEESRDLTGVSHTVGTAGYMSPEQIRGQDLDGRTDIYSLGVVFYEMITAKPPYEVRGPELLLKHVFAPIPKARQVVPELPVEADKILSIALAKEPKDRYKDMNAFADALAKLAGARPLTSPGERKVTPAPQKKQQEKLKTGLSGRKWVVPFILIAAIVLIVGVGIVMNIVNSLAATVTPTRSEIVDVTEPPINPTDAPATESPMDAPPQAPVPVTPTEASETPVPVIDLTNAATLIDIGQVSPVSVKSMFWTSNGNYLINAGSGNNNAFVLFINPVTQQEIKRVNLPAEDKVPLSMAVSPETNKIYLLFNDKIQLIDINTFKLERAIKPISGGAISLAVSPDGTRLVLGISDFKNQILDAATGAVIQQNDSYYGGWAVGYSPDAQFVVGATSQGILRWKTEKWVWQPTDGGREDKIKNLAFSKDSQLVAGGGNGVIYIWNITTGEQMKKITGQFGAINSLDFSPDGSLLISGSDDGGVYIWNTNTGQSIRKLAAHPGKVFAVCFSPDGKFIASGSNDDSTIHIWGLP